MSTEPDWPYEKIEIVDPEDSPSWLCPAEQCSCSEHEAPGEPYKFGVMLCAPSGERMRGARCRVVMNGILANPDKRNANPIGWMEVEVKRAPETVQVEWAPADTPDRPDLPYRRRYYVSLPENDLEEATRRRLYNLGFAWFPTLRQNIQDFQCEYGHPVATGEIADVDAQLRAYHDAAMLPVTRDDQRPKPLDPDPERKGFALAAFNGNDDPNSPDNNLPQIPFQGTGIDSGVVKPVLVRKTNLSSILDVIEQFQHKFKWVAVPSKVNGMEAIFWVFEDALMHKTTGRRWPCSAHEADIALGMIRSQPDELPGWPLTPAATDRQDSIFLTPMLSDLRWDVADKAGKGIDPQGFNENADVAVENGKLNTHVDKEIKAKGVTGMVGDPGKSWFLSNGLGGSVGGLPRACIYGWHVAKSRVTPSSTKPNEGSWSGGPVLKGVTADHWVVQPESTVHNTAWIDYSQLLILASGWCVVRSSSTDPFQAMKTADLYKSTTFAPLANADGKPLKLTRQPLPKTATEKKEQTKQAKLEEDSREREFRLARIRSRSGDDVPPPMTA